MSSEKLLATGFVQSDAVNMNVGSFSFTPIFEELPVATIVSVSRPETGDISPMLLSYTIEFQYKQFKWQLLKKASQVLYLHFALKKRAIIEEFHEKQEQVKEWLHSIGIVDQTAVVQDDDEPDDGAVPLHHDESVRNRDVPSRAALPILRPALGGQQSISDRGKVAMQGYLNHFLGNMDLVNSREVCKFLEVSKLSFLQEYGPKLKEGYVMVKHLPKITGANSDVKSCAYLCLDCCSNNWQKVWAVLKPGFLALLEDPFDTELLDIIVFNVLPDSKEIGQSKIYLANQIKERNPLRYTFRVACGNQSLRLRTTSNAKVKGWVTAINDAVSRPHEGWCHPHRFGSFAPPRGLADDGSQAQWFVDGEAAFEAIATSIEGAKSEIFITGWWLCPELYLRRPFHSNPSSRLDALLEEKAKQGVQIFILLYKEVSIALKINSSYSKRLLSNIHENVRVMCYPDRFPTGIYLWSHHEKLVIVDYQICFMGGLDLCFGRYDTVEHKVGDCPPHIWPGKDYYNPRESEPNSWEDAMQDELDREKYPRMPWHDVHCALWGPPCRDIARHFVQRWNHAKRNKAPNEQTIPLLMPQHHMVLPHYLGRSSEIDIEKKNKEENQNGICRENSFSSLSPTTTTNSFSSLSPVQNIPLLLPQEDGLDAPIENQKLSAVNLNHNLFDQPADDLDPDTQMKGFTDDLHSKDLKSEANLNNMTHSGSTTSDESSESSEGGDHAVAADDYGQIGPRTACHCQVVRSVSQWSAGSSQTEDSIHSAYCSLIENAEHFVYIENQFFISGLSGDEIIQNRVLETLYRRIVLAYKEQKCFRVIVVIPLLPGFQGGVDDGGAATVRAIMHWQYRTISWEKHSILHKLKVKLGPKTHDYISFYGLRTYGRLFEGGPVATSQVYVHSKVMIIDDRISLIGSSNINDRSLLGSRDSEIGVVLEDKEFLESSMNGQPWKAGKLAYSLRCSLWSEHLGLQAGEINQISDPVSDTTYKNLWLETAKENSIIYEDVFSCIPNDSIHSRAALRQCKAQWKDKHGHTTIDLGIAPEKLLESGKDGEAKETDPMERLKHVRGHLVSFPLAEIVAVKKMKRKFYFWEEYWRLREIKVLRKLNHPNIIKLKEVVRENNEVFLIFEYMNYNLYQIMKEQRRPFSEDEIRSFMSQLLHGLSHLHKSGYFHRDLKPENLLVTNDVLKIADFGLAREVSSMPPYTEYVSTRWYRAPEVLLQSKLYTPAVDMWAAGAILAELCTSSPIFPGESEIDQFFKICCVLGTPDLTVFPEGTNASRLYSFINYEKILPANLCDIIPNASPEAIDLIMQLCSWDSSRRPTADESLQHPFFQVGWIPRSLPDSLDLKLSNMGAKPTLELKLSDFGAEPEDCFLGLTLAVKPSVPDFDVVHDVSHHMKEDALFCSGLEDRSGRSVFWSLMPPDQRGICAPVEPSFSLSFSSIQHPSVRVPQSAGFSIPSLQPNILDGRFLTVSPPFPHSHCL